MRVLLRILPFLVFTTIGRFSWFSLFPFWWNWLFLWFFQQNYSKSQMSRLAFFNNFSTFPNKTAILSAKESTPDKRVVLKWKSTHSRFQNIKNYWNRSIIRDEILILVMESINFTWSRVEQRIWVIWYFNIFLCFENVSVYSLTSKQHVCWALASSGRKLEFCFKKLKK